MCVSLFIRGHDSVRTYISSIYTAYIYACIHRMSTFVIYSGRYIHMRIYRVDYSLLLSLITLTTTFPQVSLPPKACKALGTLSKPTKLSSLKAVPLN